MYKGLGARYPDLSQFFQSMLTITWFSNKISRGGVQVDFLFPPPPSMKKLEKYNILLVFSFNIDHDEKAFIYVFLALAIGLLVALTPPSPSFISPRGGGGTCSVWRMINLCPL